MTEEQIRHFETLGFFLWKGLLSPDEMRTLSDAFDAAMTKARGGEEDPGTPPRRRRQLRQKGTDYPLLRLRSGRLLSLARR